MNGSHSTVYDTDAVRSIVSACADFVKVAAACGAAAMSIRVSVIHFDYAVSEQSPIERAQELLLLDVAVLLTLAVRIAAIRKASVLIAGFSRAS